MIVAELWDKLMVFTFMAAVILTVRKLVVEAVENGYMETLMDTVKGRRGRGKKIKRMHRRKIM